MSDPVETLAKMLHDKMNHLDPDFDDKEWEQESEYQRDFCRTCVRNLLCDAPLVLAALDTETGHSKS